MVCLFTDTSVGECATDQALGPDRHPQHLSALEVPGLRAEGVRADLRCSEDRDGCSGFRWLTCGWQRHRLQWGRLRRTWILVHLKVRRAESRLDRRASRYRLSRLLNPGGDYGSEGSIV